MGSGAGAKATRRRMRGCGAGVPPSSHPNRAAAAKLDGALYALPPPTRLPPSLPLNLAPPPRPAAAPRSVHLQNFFLYFYGAAFNLLFVLGSCVAQRQGLGELFAHQSWTTSMLVVNNAAQVRRRRTAPLRSGGRLAAGGGDLGQAAIAGQPVPSAPAAVGPGGFSFITPCLWRPQVVCRGHPLPMPPLPLHPRPPPPSPRVSCRPSSTSLPTRC